MTSMLEFSHLKDFTWKRLCVIKTDRCSSCLMCVAAARAAATCGKTSWLETPGALRLPAEDEPQAALHIEPLGAGSAREPVNAGCSPCPTMPHKSRAIRLFAMQQTGPSRRAETVGCAIRHAPVCSSNHPVKLWWLSCQCARWSSSSEPILFSY